MSMKSGRWTRRQVWAPSLVGMSTGRLCLSGLDKGATGNLVTGELPARLAVTPGFTLPTRDGMFFTPKDTGDANLFCGTRAP